MRLTTTVTLTLAGTFVLGFAIVAVIFIGAAHRSAEQDAIREARIMMAAGIAARTYTDQQITPLLNHLPADEFHPESVPSSGANQILALVNKDFRDYSYRETALNPTNLSDLPHGWESDVILRFREDPSLKEIVGEQDGKDGAALFIAQPFRITNPDCLSCHSDPAAAPPAMVKRYGPVNGFRWNLNETIGARFVTVPKSARLAHEMASVEWLLVAFGCVLLVALLAALTVIHRTVTVPVHVLTARAEALSTGAGEEPELPEHGASELRGLAVSINRLHRSVRLLLAKG
jgi:protein-histidine pros-kinase